MRTYLYKVRGDSTFPFDMLRYDQAWPATTIDAFALREDPEQEVEVEIRLLSYKAPTIKRWNSFGWAVLDIERSR